MPARGSARGRAAISARGSVAGRAVTASWRAAGRWLAVIKAHPRHLVLVGFVAGLLLVFTGQLAVSAAAVVAAMVGGRRPAALAAAAAVIGGAAVAQARLDALDAGVLARMHGQRVEARVTVLEQVRKRIAGPAVARVRLLDGPGSGEQAVLRLRAYAYRGPWPGVGEEVDVSARVAPLGRADAYQRPRNAHAALEAYRAVRTGRRRGGLAGVLDGMRRRAERGLEAHLRPKDSALLRGMVLGEDEQLTDATKTEFQTSGLAHILAVSGQNVMLLAALVLFGGAVTGLALRPRLLLAIALIAVYVPLAGGGPSIQRAGVMGVAGLVAALAGQPGRRWYALGLAAAVTLVLNPRAVQEPGWQLSFAAVAALLAGAPALRAGLARRLPGPVAEVAAITLAATLGTAPLMALHFGRLSLASLPANLVAAPAIAPVMWLGMLSAAAAQAAPAFAAPFTALTGPLLVFIQWVAHTAAAAPLAAVPIHAPPAAVLAIWALAVGGVAVALRRWRHGPRRRTRLGPLAAAAAIAALLAGVTQARAGAPPLARGEVLVSFLDIGQGDATLIQLDGAAVLVDTGPPDGPILKRLAEAHVERLDALILTHAQADHEGAAAAVIREHRPRVILDGGAGWPSPVQRALGESTAGGAEIGRGGESTAGGAEIGGGGESTAAGDRGGETAPGEPLALGASRVVAPAAGDVLTLGALRLRILWPPAPPPGWKPEGDPNQRAVVARVDAGEFSLLLTADAESDVTAPLALAPVDVLKVAHHGSEDAGLPALLERLRPRAAAIEVGRHNTYGHPAPATVAALQAAVPTVVRTDRDGTVRLHALGDRMWVER